MWPGVATRCQHPRLLPLLLLLLFISLSLSLSLSLAFSFLSLCPLPSLFFFPSLTLSFPSLLPLFLLSAWLSFSSLGNKKPFANSSIHSMMALPPPTPPPPSKKVIVSTRVALPASFSFSFSIAFIFRRSNSYFGETILHVMICN